MVMLRKMRKKNTIVIVDGDMSIVYDESSLNLTRCTSHWVIDLGASFHITAHCDYFTTYINCDYGHISIRNDGASKIVGIGDIYLETSIDYKLLLKDVKYVSYIHLNLISTCKIDNDSYTKQLGERKWKLTKGSQVLAK